MTDKSKELTEKDKAKLLKLEKRGVVHFTIVWGVLFFGIGFYILHEIVPIVFRHSTNGTLDKIRLEQLFDPWLIIMDLIGGFFFGVLVWHFSINKQIKRMKE